MADIGDNPEIGIGNFTERFDFTRMVGSHFYDTEFGGFVHTEQGEGDADVVVEIPLSGESLEFFDNTAWQSSLVVVLPLVPVIPRIGMCNCCL
jgi:hypothetical protein